MSLSTLLLPPGVTRRQRMIRTLISENRWVPQEVAAEFDLSMEEVEEARSLNASYEYTLAQLLDAVSRRINRTGRWPRRDEWRNANGLPSASTINRFYDGWRARMAGRRRTQHGAMQELQRDLASYHRLRPRGALALTNVTHRRDAMARFKPEELIRHMSLVHDDPDVGTLFRTRGQGMLRVTNSTPEPDGTHAVYVLAVPPEMEFARQALAWTFGVTTGWEDFVLQEQS